MMARYYSLILDYPPSSNSFFFTVPPPPEVYTLSLHELFRSPRTPMGFARFAVLFAVAALAACSHAPPPGGVTTTRSEEHTSELQSHVNLVCRLLLEKKKIGQPLSGHN